MNSEKEDEKSIKMKCKNCGAEKDKLTREGLCFDCSLKKVKEEIKDLIPSSDNIVQEESKNERLGYSVKRD